MRRVDEVGVLVEAEIARFSDPIRRQALRRILVAPRLESREWDYGSPGQRFDCWIVGEVPELDLKLAYCDEGFGPSDPWGAVFASESSIGMDSQWHDTLEQVCRSFLWGELSGDAV